MQVYTDKSIAPKYIKNILTYANLYMILLRTAEYVICLKGQDSEEVILDKYRWAQYNHESSKAEEICLLLSTKDGSMRKD